MPPPCKQTLLIGLVVLYAVSMQMPIGSQSAAADGSYARGQQSHRSLLVCIEYHHPEWAFRPFGTHAPRARIVHTPLVEEEGLVELQVPAALLTALQTAERRGTSVELQVPEGLLTILQTEGGIELP
jgi:hypothetical protein